MRPGLEEYVRKAIQDDEPWYMDHYRGICRAKGPPKEGFYRVVIPRQQRRYHRRSYWAARIWRPLPIDPDTFEILDRVPNLAGEIEGRDADYRKVWALGEKISEERYAWLRALNALIL